MRLAEIERGDSLGHRILIGVISMVAGIRLPDAARVAFYHQDFVAKALGAWTQATLRGPSSWSVSERELMAALVAKWNTCPFCVGAHSAIAIKGMPRDVVDAALADYRAAPLPRRLVATLGFLEKMTSRRPSSPAPTPRRPSTQVSAARLSPMRWQLLRSSTSLPATPTLSTSLSRRQVNTINRPACC